MLAVAGGVENPLAEGAHGGEAGASLREHVFRWVVRSPAEHFFSNGRKIRAELAAEIAYEGPESRQQLFFLKETPQLVVSGLEEVLADVAQKVEVTAEDGDLQLQLPNEVLSRRPRRQARAGKGSQNVP